MNKLTTKLHRHPVLVPFLFWLVLGVFYYFNRALRLDVPDFKVFYYAGKLALTNPVLLYRESPDVYLYPPPSALFFAPFALIPWEIARAVWYFSIVGVCFLLTQGSWVRFFSFLAVFRYVLINLHYGQINLHLLFAMCASGLLLTQGKSLFASFWLSLASMLKLFPLVQIGGAVFERRYKVILWSGAFLILFSLIPFIFWNPSDIATLWHEFPQQLFGRKGAPAYSHNQSFSALLLRFFEGVPFALPSAGETDWTLIRLPKQLLLLTGFTLGLTVTGLTWWKALTRKLPLDTLSAACLTVIFLPHLVWKAYFIFLFPALVQVFESRERAWRWIIAALIFEFLTGPDIWGFKIAARLDALNLHQLAALCFTVAWFKLRPLPRT